MNPLIEGASTAWKDARAIDEKDEADGVDYSEKRIRIITAGLRDELRGIAFVTGYATASTERKLNWIRVLLVLIVLELAVIAFP